MEEFLHRNPLFVRDGVNISPAVTDYLLNNLQHNCGGSENIFVESATGLPHVSEHIPPDGVHRGTWKHGVVA